MGPKANSKSSKGSKQNGNKSNGGKLQSQDIHARKELNGEPNTDYSLLRKSIPINPYGASQIAKAYHSGSPEMLFLLDHECEVILECRACRNLFRSLANFISHKRVYCREFYSDKKRVFPPEHLLEDKTTVIQPEPVGPNCRNETWVTSDTTSIPTNGEPSIPSSSDIQTSIPPIATYKNPKKDLSQIVEKLSQQRGVKTVTETVAHISASKFYEGVSDRLVAKKDACKEHTIRLEAMENTKYGVFQTVLQSSSSVQMENTDFMKAQVVELHNMMSCNEATLGPDGRVAMINGEGTTDLASSGGNDSTLVKKYTSSPSSKSGSPKEDHVCTICNTRFSTRKTLNHHMKSLHVTFRMCYPCPCCKNTFCNTWSVYRHLYKVHRKTTLQVRKLRSQIVNKAFKKEVPEEGQSSNIKSNVPAQTEADKARKEQQRLHQENQDWMNNFEDDLELQMCGGCGRRFERRAALNSHSQICQKRIAVQNIKTRRPSPSNSTSTTSNRLTSAKLSPPSTDWQNTPQAENSKQENTNADNNTNRLTPLSMQSESSGLKYIITPSPSPVPHDQFLSSSPSATFQRTRNCSGSSSAKKDMPEKRIEIQIRRDYCKTGTSSGSISSASVGGGSINHHQDSNSESNENPLSSGDIGHDDEASNDSKQYQSRDLGTDALKRDNDIPVLNVCRYPGRRTEPSVDVDCDNEDIDYDDIHSVADNESGNRSSNQSDRNNSSSMGSPVSDKTKSEGQDDTSSKDDAASSRRTSGNSEDMDLAPCLPDDQEIQIIPKINIKKEEQFVPIMEEQMQSMINIKRLQCLPCQKKFNKLTNLRRHVAVHIGWNRYRCIECPFKCFSKYDCVAHVNKIHLEKPDRDKAQSMVEYIETQVCDNENDTIKQEIDESEENNVEVTELTFHSMYDNEIKDENFDCGKKETLNNRISEWTVTENGENETISDDICNDENSTLKAEHKSETCKQQASEIDKEDLVKDMELSTRLDPVINNSELKDKLKCEKGNKTQVDAITTVEVRVKPGRGRPRKRLASSDSVRQGQSEAVPLKKRTAREFQLSKDITPIETEEKPKINDTEPENSETEDTEENEEPEDSPSKVQELQQQTALRKMVLQVIFGAGNSSGSQDTETSDNMFAIAMNGEIEHSGESESSPEPYDVVEAVSSSNSTSPFTSTGSTTSPASTSDDAADTLEQLSSSTKEESKNMKQHKTRTNTPTLDIERRQRPVRHRVKVEREDFIYDLSDRCLDPKRDGEERNKGAKRKHQEGVKVVVDKDNCSGENSGKVIPKLMLVRTNMGEYSGVKVIKSSSNSNVPQLTDANSEKTSVNYNISTRKSQRTFDISLHKTSKQ